MKRTENNNIETISENELDIFPQLIDADSVNHRTVLIKHDYYSSDTDHGRALLSAFLDVLSDESGDISNIILIDSGTHLLCLDDPCHKKLMLILSSSVKLYACRESVETYIANELIPENIELITAQSIALELLDSNNLFILE